MSLVLIRKATCPYCEAKLVLIPLGKLRCPSCKQVMHIKAGLVKKDLSVPKYKVMECRTVAAVTNSTHFRSKPNDNA